MAGKTICVALALANCASAFMAPSSMRTPIMSDRTMTMSATNGPVTRGEVLSTAFAAALAATAVPGAALADGAKSLSTQSRARGIYGARIFALDSAVKSGDFAAVLDEKNAFILFNSGVYSTNKEKKAAATSLSKAVVAAAEAGDKAALQDAYKKYVSVIESKSGYASAGDGQGLGSDFDWKNSRTPKGTVYQVCTR
ncbi:unnamed protein product [Discosporangium mesarthrocarpum]